MKHHLKLFVREVYARVLYHTGLCRLIDRLLPRRLTILAGHCVVDEATNGNLPADMKIAPERLERILRVLGARFELCTVGEGVRALDAGPGRSLVALSMDDGYKDNLTVLAPLLERARAKATVFLITRPLIERRLDWSHALFWLLAQRSAREVYRDYIARCGDDGTRIALQHLIDEDDLAYRAKRVLKYDAPAGDRERTLQALFEDAGGDERALCDRIFMTTGDVRELAARGVELGGHTHTHEILARLSPAAAAAEIEEGREHLLRELGPGALETFAYPFGRRWDFDEASVETVRKIGFRAAVTTHAGTNERISDRMRLARWMIDDATPLHLLVTEASGGFALLRRMGLDLSD